MISRKVLTSQTLQKSFMFKHHYVYHSYEEWGRGYIGIRSCDCLPEEDIGYFGSFKDKTFNPTEKTILLVRETRQEVVEIEIMLHDFFDVAVNPQFANRSKQKSTRFDTTGVPITEGTKKKISEANSGEKNPMYGVPGKIGALHSRSRAIIAIQPDGTKRQFGGGREAARELEINQGSLCKYLKTGNVLKKGEFKGWQFVYENPGRKHRAVSRPLRPL